MTHRKVKHGFWDEDLRAQVDAVPFPSAEDQFFSEEEEPAEHCTHGELYDALKTLTARQAFVIRLHYGIECEAMTVGQIALLLAVTHQTVGEHIAAGKRSLEETLRNEY